MGRKSIAQEYYTLTVDKNGNMPPMRRDEANAGLVAAGFMDLLLNQVIEAEKKKITVRKDLPEELSCLTSLYTYLKEKNRSVSKLMTDYYTGRRIKQLAAEVGETLFAENLAETGEGGLFGPKITYIPERSYKNQLIKDLHTVIKMEDDEMPAHDAALICILSETKSLKQYFSKFEQDELKEKLREMKKDSQNKELKEMINYVSDWITVMMACTLIHVV